MKMKLIDVFIFSLSAILLLSGCQGNDMPLSQEAEEFAISFNLSQSIVNFI